MEDRTRKSSSLDLNMHLVTSFILRLLLVAYGVFHDATNSLKYTDVDYHVVTDAAREVSRGESPYNRHTYRYTPLLSILLLPNIYLNSQFGKLIFSALDCLIGKIIHTIMCMDGHSPKMAAYGSFLWLYNPVVVAISTRGSPECVVVASVMCFIYCAKMRLPILSGLFLGISVHLKLYPIIYTLPVYLSFTKNYSKNTLRTKLLPNISKIRFVCAMFVGFVVPSFLCYVAYGEQYLDESFWYHFVRRDIRHNFSLYFYVLYLCMDCGSVVTSVLTFGPQAIVVAAVGFRYGSPRDLSFGLFLQTFLFVAFNKVVTSQYFVWYLVILPLVTPRLKLTAKKSLFLFGLWIFAQCSWLLPAYLLEFHGINAFIPLWLESIAFFCSNVGVAISLIRAYDSSSTLGNEVFLRKIR